MNEQLVVVAKVALANIFVMYFKSHSYHWNVEGRDFEQYHSFLNDLYDDLWGSVDGLAERIRTADAYAPISLEELYSFKTIMEDQTKPAYSQQMFANLLQANDQVVEALNKLFAACTAANKQGFANFVADRLDVHAKHAWMLKSFMKSGE